MSWNDFYRRRELLATVLEHARHDGAETVALSEIPGAAEEFGTAENLLLALHHQWSQRLTGQLRNELSAASDDDQPDAVSRAWHATSEREPTLRAVIVNHLDSTPALRDMHDGDMRMLAIAAGLAEPAEPEDESTAIGAAFIALITDNEAPRARRRNPMDHLMRLLAPTA